MRNAPVRRRRKEKINMTSLIYHTVREQFGGKQGVTVKELETYLEENNIAFSPTSVYTAVAILSGRAPRNEYRDEFTSKVLRKDGYLTRGKNESTRVIKARRYYYNPAGTVRVLPIEGHGVWHNTGITGVVVAKLSRMTNTLVSLTKF